MAKPYSEEFRKRVFILIEAGKSVETVASLFCIGRATVFAWVKKYKETGSFAPEEKWQKGYGNKITDSNEFIAFVKANKNLSAVEMAEKWGNITPKTFRKYLRKHGFTFKKKLLDIVKEAKKNVKFIWNIQIK